MHFTIDISNFFLCNKPLACAGLLNILDLHCVFILYNTILYYIILCYTILYNNKLYNIIQYNII